MNAAVTAALIAAQQNQSPTPVERLTKAKANRSDTAIAIEPATPAERKQLDQAIALGLIHRRADGRFFLNERAVAERNEAMGYQFLLGLLIIASILASVAALLLFAPR